MRSGSLRQEDYCCTEDADSRPGDIPSVRRGGGLDQPHSQHGARDIDPAVGGIGAPR